MRHLHWMAATLTLGSIAHANAPAQAELDRARSLFSEGQFPQAAEAYRAFLAKDPGKLAAWQELGNALHAMGKNEEALKVWENVLRINPADIHTLNASGEVQLGLKNFGPAEAFFERSLKQEPNQPNLRVRLGEACEGLAKWDKANQQYDLRLKADPQNVDVLLHRARVDERQGEFKKPIARLAAVLHRTPQLGPQLTPRLAHLWGSIGDQAYARTDFAGALAAYQEGLKWEAGNGRLLTGLGWAYRFSGKNGAALEAWNRALSAPEAATPSLLRAMGDTQFDQGDFSQARLLLERARGLAPQDPGSSLKLLEVGFVTKDQKLQLDSLEAVRAIPNLDPAWAERAAEMFIRFEEIPRGLTYFQGLPADAPPRGLALARIYSVQASREYEAGHLQAAIQLYKSALEAAPTSRIPLRDLGWAYAKAGDWTACAATWRRFTELYPKMAESHDLLAEGLEGLRDFKGAIAEERIALSLEPGMRSARLRIMRALAKDGQVAATLEIAAKLAKEFPDDLPIQMRYAEVLTKFRDHAAAKKVWGHIRELDPNNYRAQLTWIRESYDTEDYGPAVAAALKLAEQKPAPEAVLIFLAQDALGQNDHNEAARYFRRLTEDYPHKAEYWLQLGEELQTLYRLDDALTMVNEGLRLNPGNIDLEIHQAECLLEVKQIKEATALFHVLSTTPGNRVAFRGLFNSLQAGGQLRKANALMQGTLHESYLTSYERSLWKADLLAGLGQFPAAHKLLQEVIHPDAGTRNVPVILYHGLITQTRSLSVAPATFDEHMAALAKAGYTTLTITGLIDVIEGRQPWPAHPILITFDDARTDSFLEADPILQRYHFNATMFVPTAEPNQQADMFHASWETIQRFAKSGRWDMQGHGFEAHELIPLDAAGNLGKFLAARAWIDDLGRNETEQEFAARLNADYKQCKEMLEAQLPGDKPAAYAFPFNEAGQLNVGNATDATSTNETIWRKYFRFGMVQDASGYNTIKIGEQGTRLIWRFEPLRNWTGQDLIAHLNQSAPENTARLQVALLRLWQGYNEDARRDFEALAKDFPTLRPLCEKGLAEVAWAEAQPREANSHIQNAIQSSPELALEAQRNPTNLANQIRWEVAPIVTLGTVDQEGSDHRSIYQDYLRVRYPFSAPVDLELQASKLRYADIGQPDLAGSDFQGRLKWSPSHYFDLSGWAGQRSFTGLSARAEGGTELEFRYNLQNLRIDANRLGMDTDTALRAGIDQHEIDVKYDLHFEQWIANATGTHENVSDGNGLNFASAFVLFHPLALDGWHFGPELDAANSRTYSSSYYTPLHYQALQARAQYLQSFPMGSSFSLTTDFGRFKDDVHPQSWCGLVETNWVMLWTKQFKSTLDLVSGSKAGYKSNKIELSLSWLF